MTLSLRKMFLENTPLLDVRAPTEFQQGAFPNSTNIPLLDDEQRHKIGICYKEHGQEKAIALGWKMFPTELREQRIDSWRKFTQANPNGFLYCFRGGLRSKITREWIAETGIDYPMIEGGYKSLRAYLIEQLDLYSADLPFTILGGRTGSGKTKLLHQLKNHIDLEGLAVHRGSSFGALLTPQPSNIDFENALSIDMIKHNANASQRIFIEDEGRLIGRVCIPQTLRERMKTLPVIELIETLEHRIAVAESDYITDLLSRYQSAHGDERGLELFTAHHHTALHKIRKRFGGDRVEKTLGHFNNALGAYKKETSTEHFHPYIKALLTEYYDPMYDYQFSKKDREIVFRGDTEAVLAWVEQDF